MDKKTVLNRKDVGMDKDKVNIKKNESFDETKSNFGKYGWLMIFFATLFFFLNAGIQTDGLNISVPAIAKLRGWDKGTLLSFATPAGWIAVLGSIIFGRLSAKKGPKFVIIVTLCVLGIATIAWGRVDSIWIYFGIQCIIMSVLNGLVYIAGPALVSNWFPRKNALAIGWANMGANISTAAYVPFFTWLEGTLGITKAFTIVGIIVLVVFVGALFLVKNYPEQAGAYPDNDKTLNRADIDAFNAKVEEYRKSSPWTVRKLLKTSQVWKIGIGGGGILMLMTVGLMSQLIPRLMEAGFERVEAVSLMSFCAILATPMGYVFGYVSQKLGTRKGCLLFYIWFILTFVLNVIPNRIALYVSLFMIAGAIAGSNDFMLTLTQQVFGRFDYSNAMTVIMPINSVVRSAGYAIVGLLNTATGGFTIPYLVLAGIGVVGMIIVYTLDDSLIGKSEEEMKKEMSKV